MLSVQDQSPSASSLVCHQSLVHVPLFENPRETSRLAVQETVLLDSSETDSTIHSYSIRFFNQLDLNKGVHRCDACLSGRGEQDAPFFLLAARVKAKDRFQLREKVPFLLQDLETVDSEVPFFFTMIDTLYRLVDKSFSFPVIV
jgi:hypothetical protein